MSSSQPARPGFTRSLQSLALAAAAALAAAPAHGASPDLPADPLFDLAAIMSEPVDLTVLTSETTNGVVFQVVEYTTRTTNGKPERIQGLFAFPEGGQKLPGVYWSMGGMAKATRDFPGLLARKGYACLAVTLPHALRQSFRIPFDAANPQSANLTLLARDQLRGITALAGRPEVNPDRLAVGGASYGGVFATLIAGVDPRIKAGFSFFGGGHHELGTSLPQFLKMGTVADVEAWGRTIDPAFRLTKKEIPFLWGVAFNDHWFHFPAVSATYLEASGTGKRIVIMPHWQHGFPAEVDKTLFDFLDTTPVSANPRPAYNAPGPVTVRKENGHAVASFSWTGGDPVAKAELVVSYGEVTPWLGWPHRAAFILPAAVSGQTATARLPIPSRRLPLIVWGTLTDTNQLFVSTPPLTLTAKDLSQLPADPSPVLNCFPDGNLGDDVLTFYRLSGETLAGLTEKDAACSGGQVQRIDPVTNDAPSFSVRHFHNVPGLAHRLTLRLKAEKPTTLSVSLTPIRPSAWSFASVKTLVVKDPRLAPLLPRWADAPAPYAVTSAVGTAWQDVVLEIPAPSAPVDGYTLAIRETPESRTPYWLDTLLMQPLWP
jgi:dienelactone hydrolase